MKPNETIRTEALNKLRYCLLKLRALGPAFFKISFSTYNIQAVYADNVMHTGRKQTVSTQLNIKAPRQDYQSSPISV